MSITLKPLEYRSFKITVPRFRKPGLRYIVDAQFPIAVYLVDYDNLRNFNEEQPFVPMSGGKNSRYFARNIDLPYSGDWYLILWNTNETPSEVSFETYV